MRKVILIITLLILPISAFATDYGSDFITGGTATAQYELCGAPYLATAASDNNSITRWASCNNPYTDNWWRYDLGAGITKKAAKLRVESYSDGNGQGIKDFFIRVSNDNWTTSSTIATGTVPNVADGVWSEITWTPSTTGYRYYAVDIDSAYGSAAISVYEFEMMEALETSTSTATSTSTIAENTQEQLYLLLVLLLVVIGFILGYKVLH